MRLEGKKPIIGTGILITLFITAGLFFLRPISDPDVFWHMKAGEWIWQHGALPDEDPFAFTSTGKQSFQEQLILKGYWLSQIMYHLFFSALGINGIIVLRMLLAALLVWSVVKRCRGDRVVMISLISASSFFLLSFYTIERPQFLSFILFSLMLMLLDRFRHGKSAVAESGRFLPEILLIVFMIFWANMHTGYFLGVITIIVVVLMEGLKYAHPSLQAMQPSTYRRMAIAAVLVAAASFINPNGFSANILSVILTHIGIGSKSGVLLSAHMEYLSTLTYVSLYHDYRIFIYWTMVILSVISLLLSIRRADITVIALLLGTGYVSFMHIRYIPFFLLVAVPFIVSSLSEPRFVRTARIALAALSLLAVAFLILPEMRNVRRIADGKIDIDNVIYPVEAATFVAQNNLTGNMFNHFDWGGYLIWRLGPDRKVFIDSRNLFTDIFWDAMLINWAYEKGSGSRPKWKELLDRYEISYIIFPVIPSSEPARRPIPLLFALLRDENWVPVFARGNAVVFVRNTPEFGHIIRRYGIRRDAFKGLYAQ